VGWLLFLQKLKNFIIIIPEAVVVVSNCVHTNACMDNPHGNVHSGTCVGHMMQYVLLACPVDALASHSGDTHTCWRKGQRGLGVHCMQQVGRGTRQHRLRSRSVFRLSPPTGCNDKALRRWAKVQTASSTVWCVLANQGSQHMVASETDDPPRWEGLKKMHCIAMCDGGGSALCRYNDNEESGSTNAPIAWHPLLGCA
jgi:hypothetical protein